MGFPKTEVIKGIAEKMISGEYETFICNETQCPSYHDHGGPCIYVNPPHPDRMPVGCQHSITIRKYEISVEPLTCHPDNYEHDEDD